MHSWQHSSRQGNRGMGLTEILIAMAIVSVLAAVATPAYQDLIERNRLRQVTEALADDLQWARTEAIKNSCDVSLAWVDADHPEQGYAVNRLATGPACVAATLKTVNTAQQFGNTVALAINPVTYTFRRGTLLGNDAVDITSTVTTAHYTTRVISEPSGRVRICSRPALAGYETCPAAPVEE